MTKAPAEPAKTMFDFGRGPVPAHRHKNPCGRLGGWVADTATVAPTAYVGPDALVYDDAQVTGRANVTGHAQVYDGARVYDGAWVHGYARLTWSSWVSEDAK